MANTRKMAQRGGNPTKTLQTTLYGIARRLFNKKVWKKVWKITWISGFVGLAALFGAFLYVLKDLPSPDKLNERQVAESTKILDRSGKTVLYEIHGEEKRTRVPVSEIAKTLQQATLSAEDKSFYKHFGFDARGILRAVFKNSTGGSLQGGSTITQQLVKNSILTSERTLSRKIKELILAIEVEIRFSKDEILEMYLNQIPYGSNAYGSEAAARTFFGKSAKDLTLAESATLAATPKAPTFYSPYGANTDRLKERRDWILDRMVEDNYITQDEADAAKAEEIKAIERNTGIIAGHFVDLVRQELVDRFGERMSEQGGLKVTTTLDLVKQEMAERTVRDGVARNEQGGYRASNAALTAIDPKTGEVLAMQGSVDYFSREKDGNVNVATRERQPGSSFKPIVYAAAFKKGYTPNTILFDVETDFGGGYHPRNYSLNQNGPLPMGNALARSLNIPAVQTLYLVGVDRAIAFAHEMGITTLQEAGRYGLSLVLGGGEVKLVDMVSVYGVFANEGMRQPYITILTVEDPSGKLLLDNRNRQGQRVLDEQIARLMNGVLSDDGARAPTFGSRSYLTIPGRASAAKSGTTNDFHDAWTIGYVPSLAAGVWVGNNNNAEMSNGADGSKVAAPIWQAFMKEALANVPAESFTRPAPERTGKAILDGQMAEEEEVRLCKPSLKRATDRCPASQIELKKFRKLHSILYYVDKDNPRGPFPSNPAKDPQFNSWEGAVKKWAEQKKITLEDPPKEFDDTHDDVDAPHVTVLSPKPNEKVSGTTLNLSLAGSAEHGLKKVEVFIDGIPFASGAKLPALMSVRLPGVKSGFHTVLVRATDTIDNIGETSVPVNLRVLTPMSISIVSLANGAKFKESSFPVPFEVVLAGEVGAKTIEMKVKDGEGATVFSKTITASVGVTSYVREMLALDPGAYIARATVTDVNGAVSTAEEVSFTVKP